MCCVLFSPFVISYFVIFLLLFFDRAILARWLLRAKYLSRVGAVMGKARRGHTLEDRLICGLIREHAEADHVRDKSGNPKNTRQGAFRRNMTLIRRQLSFYNYKTLMLYHPAHGSYWVRKPGQVATFNL